MKNDELVAKITSRRSYNVLCDAAQYLVEKNPEKSVNLFMLARLIDPNSSFVYNNLLKADSYLSKERNINSRKVYRDSYFTAQNKPVETSAVYSLNKVRDKFFFNDERFGSNNLIWMFWDSDETNYPPVVKASIESWMRQNPDYEVILLNKINIINLLGFDFFKCFELLTVDIGLAGKTDLLRVFLLATYGGVWVDATTFCIEPLSSWLPDILERNDFFCFRQFDHCKDRQLVSWFMASHKNSSILDDLLGSSIEYLFKDRDFVLKLVLHAEEWVEISGPTATGLNTLNEMESKFLYVPYFWMFYVFNDVVSKKDNARAWVSIRKETNRYVLNHSPIDEFKSSLVSKQTYHRNYAESKVCLSRMQYIKSLISI